MLCLFASAAAPRTLTIITFPTILITPMARLAAITKGRIKPHVTAKVARRAIRIIHKGPHIVIPRSTSYSSRVISSSRRTTFEKLLYTEPNTLKPFRPILNGKPAANIQQSTPEISAVSQ